MSGNAGDAAASAGGRDKPGGPFDRDRRRPSGGPPAASEASPPAGAAGFGLLLADRLA
jgi:hypothetical protein